MQSAMAKTNNGSSEDGSVQSHSTFATESNESLILQHDIEN